MKVNLQQAIAAALRETAEGGLHGVGVSGESGDDIGGDAGQAAERQLTRGDGDARSARG